ncbi:MAG: sugar phosphate isomerase/epimerase family protein [Eubacteriales bacterium]
MENKKIPVGVELYSVRKALSEDLEGTLEALASYGYEAVEFAGAPQYTPARTAAALRASGLTVSSWHTPYDALLTNDETFYKTAAHHLACGNRYMVIPWMPEDWMNSLESLKVTAEKLNKLSERLAEYGMFTGYHNHTAEFKPVGDTGKTTWTLLRELTCPQFLMQMDTGNCMAGDGDVNAELLAGAGRSQIVHLKPYSKTKGYATMIGDDDIDYKTIMNFCKKDGGTQIYVIEYEDAATYSELEGVRVCIERLKTLYGDLL